MSPGSSKGHSSPRLAFNDRWAHSSCSIQPTWLKPAASKPRSSPPRPEKADKTVKSSDIATNQLVDEVGGLLGVLVFPDPYDLPTSSFEELIGNGITLAVALQFLLANTRS